MVANTNLCYYLVKTLNYGLKLQYIVSEFNNYIIFLSEYFYKSDFANQVSGLLLYWL